MITEKNARLYFGGLSYADMLGKTLAIDDTVRVTVTGVVQDLPGNSDFYFGTIVSRSTLGYWSNRIKFNDGHKDIQQEVQVKMGDSNYIRLFHLPLLAGTGLPQSDTSNAIIVNATEARALGFRDPHAALGRTLDFDNHHPVIVGVVADFHQHSVHDAISPMVIVNGGQFARTIIVGLPQGHSDTWPATIARMEKAFHGVYPGYDFDYHFVDETVAKFYASEQKTARLLTWATGLAIFISCLGLLGLVIYITNQRIKEIGVRKVIGASVMQIVALAGGSLLQEELCCYALRLLFFALGLLERLLPTRLTVFEASDLFGAAFFAGGAFSTRIASLIQAFRAASTLTISFTSVNRAWRPMTVFSPVLTRICLGSLTR